MSKQFNFFAITLGAIMLSRLFAMYLLPFADTTEPRYAEIARLMVETNDWITPWFEPGVPFWGKPPLSFWLQAGAIKLFGLQEFVPRLPSWLASAGILYLTWCYARQIFDEITAWWSLLVLSTTALFYISAGTVMTDSFLALGTVLSQVSFGMVMSGNIRFWRWGFFLGLVIGLLAKGPIALILTLLPIGLWICWHLKSLTSLRLFPWIKGLLLTFSLTLPWYIAAELKTPGFLDYFIIGEHYLRFINPGWTGDLYGSGHAQPKGMIWIFWLWATFPWGIIFAAGLIYHFAKGNTRSLLQSIANNTQLKYILLAALGPLLFFTLASNTLWTYALPSLPFSAILVAKGLKEIRIGATLNWKRCTLLGFIPALLTAFTLATTLDEDLLKSEASIIGYYAQHLKTPTSRLFYLDDMPFSARYYSLGKAEEITLDELISTIKNNDNKQLFVAVPRKTKDRIQLILPAGSRVVASNRRFQLIGF